MQKEMNKENIQFRILYFIGILLVVAGHAGGGSTSLFYEWFPIYSFHMALFIFCSGYFFINNKDKKIIDVIKKLIKKFLIPLYLWNLFYGILLTILHKCGIEFGLNISLKSLFILPMYDGHQFILNLASWFVWPLVIIQFINIFVLKILNKNDKLYYLYFLITLLLGFIGVTIAIKGYNKGFYLLLDKVLYFLPFFSLGMLYRVKLEKKDTSNNLIYFSILLFITLIEIYIFGGTERYFIAWCKNFDNFYRPFIVGIIGIAFWLRVSKILVPILKDNKIINKISKNTFGIMMHHLTGFFLLSTIWYLLSKVGIITKFNVHLYKNEIYYFYLPKGIKNFIILYVVAGFAYSLFVINIIDKIKTKLKK